MTEYSVLPFDLVDNVDYCYYRLLINGECRIDEFISKIEDNVRHKKSFESIIALMDFFGPHKLLPKEKFRQIDAKRDDVFEFKKNEIRVYVIKQPPYIYVVMGGFKKEQTKDVKRLKRDLKGFPDSYNP